MIGRSKPLFMIGVVASMLKVHPQTLRLWERKGLLRPSRTEGRTRLYSEEDVEELARLLRLTRDLGVNLAGVEVILRMRRKMVDMQKQIDALVAHIRESGHEPPAGATSEAREALVPVGRRQKRAMDLF